MFGLILLLSDYAPLQIGEREPVNIKMFAKYLTREGVNHGAEMFWVDVPNLMSTYGPNIKTYKVNISPGL